MIYHKYFVSLCVIIFSSINLLIGQNDTTRANTKLHQERLIRQHTWLNSANAAGLKIHDISNYNNFGFHYNTEKGDFKTSLKPETLKNYGVSTSGYKSLENVDFQGSFKYNRFNENDIRWVSMMDANRENPFHIADSTSGDWKKDIYTLRMKMGTSPLLGNLRFGVSADYRVAQGGRDSDPRPKSVIKDFKVVPAVVWDFLPDHHLGINFNYRDYRQDLNIMNEYGVGGNTLYKIIGLALLDQPLVKSTLEYRIDSWTRGGALQYGFELGKVDFLADLSYDLLSEKATQSPYKGMRDPESNTIVSIAESDVRFSEEIYNVSVRANYETPSVLHSVLIDAQQGDGKTYFISSEQVEYVQQKTSAKFAYEMINRAADYKMEFITRYNNHEQENLFYGKQIIEKTDIQLSGEKEFALFNYKIAASIDFAYSLDMNSSLNLNPQSDFINETYDITDPYVKNNFFYMASDHFYGQAGITYYIPFNIKSKLFMELKCSYLKAIEESYFNNKDRVMVSGSMGLLF